MVIKLLLYVTIYKDITEMHGSALPVIQGLKQTDWGIVALNDKKGGVKILFDRQLLDENL